VFIYGINPTMEALRAGTVSELWVRGDSGRRVVELADRASEAGVVVHRVQTGELERLAPGGEHQGVVAQVAVSRQCSVEDLLTAAVVAPLLLVLDGIEDPRNFGAVARTAEAAGVDGMIYQSRRSAPPGATAIKASAGALAHLRLASVVNISRTLEELKRAGVWTVGLDDGADTSYDSLDLTAPTAFVIGAEGRGLRRLVRERCDWLVSIPMRGRVSSVNVSVAAGIALFEALRQRGGGGSGGPMDIQKAGESPQNTRKTDVK